MVVGVLASRATGFIRTAVIASAIGTAIGDAYNLANALPNIVYELLLGGVLTSIIVPLLVAGTRKDDDENAFAQRLLTLVAVVLAVASIIAVFAAPWLIRLYSLSGGTGLPKSEMALATLFARFFLPQIFFYGVGALLGAILNTRGSFARPMWVPVLNNLVLIATGVAFLVISRQAPQAGHLTTAQWLVLSIGTTLGIIAQTVALVPALRAVRFPLRPRWDWRGVGLRHAARLSAWVFVYVLANQIGYLVIINLASTVRFGISSYTYAFILVSLPHAVVGVSVITALLPRMSRSALDGRLEDVSSDLARGLKLAAVVLVPAELLLVALGPLLATVVFAHYNLDLASARFIGYTVMAFASGLVPLSIFQLQLRAFYALRDTRTPALVNIGVNAVNLAADFVLFVFLGGRSLIIGLAAGYALSYLVGAVVFTLLLRRKIGAARGARVKRTYVRLSAAALPAAAVAWLVAWAITAGWGEGALPALAAVVAGGLVAAAIFVGASETMKIEEVRYMLRSTRGRLSTMGSTASSDPGGPHEDRRPHRV
jgi:putative peptidoglycan lipid II flippase